MAAAPGDILASKPPLPMSASATAARGEHTATASHVSADAAPLDSHLPAVPRISIRSAGALLGDIKAILQQPAVDKLEALSEVQAALQ